MKRLILALMLVAVIIGQTARPASAVCTSCSCNVQSSSLTFPSYTFLLAASSSSTMGYSCTGNVGATVAVQISLSAGSGSYAQRTMTGPGTPLNYQLYTPLGLVFGDGTVGTGNYTGAGLIGLFGTLAGGALVNGTIPANQAVKSGQYNDSLIETISF
jgi:spore coat protein U-like protein